MSSPKLTQQQAEQRCRDSHGDRYSLDRFIFRGTKKKACFTCFEHGDFWQTPSAHWSGQNCPDCVVETAQKIAEESFRLRSAELHQNFYFIPKQPWFGYHVPLLMVCPLHWEFYQTPTQHLLTGSGCPTCGHIKIALSKRRLFIDVLRDFKRKHGAKFLYHKSKFIDMRTPILIICKEHGEFWQTPKSHLKSTHACPLCSRVFREIRLGNRTVRVRGLEDAALQWICDNTKVDLDKVLVDTEHETYFEYIDGGIKRKYIPDFIVQSKQIVVEVKSLCNSGLTSDVYFNYTSEESFRKLQLKGAAVIKAGYKFIPLIMARNGKRYKLPKNWVNMSRKQVLKYLANKQSPVR